MGSVTVLFDFGSGLQGFTANPGTSCTLTRDTIGGHGSAKDGSTIGCLSNVRAVKAATSATSTWTQTLSYNAMGVPTGAIVTGISSPLMQYSLTNATSPGASGQTHGAVTLNDGVNTSFNLSAQVTGITTVDATGTYHTSNGTGTTFIPVASSASATITISNTLSNANTTGSTVTLLQDSLTFTVTYIVPTVGGSGNQSINQNLLGHWPLNEGSGTTVHDTSGNLHHGTISGTFNPITWTNTAPFGEALQMNGVASGGGYVDLGTIGNFTATSSFSVCYWVRYNAAHFTASQSGTTLTVTALAGGKITLGMQVQTTGAASLATITSFSPGTTGGTGTYTVSTSATVTSTTWMGGYYQFQPPVAKLNGSSPFTGWYIYMDLSGGSYGAFSMIDTAGTNATATLTEPAASNTWHLIAAVVDRTAQLAKISMDGMPFHTASCSTLLSTANNTNMSIGLTTQVAIGNIQLHDLRLYNRAITHSEINQLYRQKKQPAPTFRVLQRAPAARVPQTFNVTTTESGTGASTQSAVATFAGSDADSGTGSTTQNGAATYHLTQSASGSATSSPSAVGNFAASDTESGTGSTTQNGAATYHLSETEAGSASDAETAGTISTRSDSESGSASASQSTTVVFAASDSESAAATVATNGAATYHLMDAETGTAVASASGAGTYPEARNESGSSSATTGATLVVVGTINESLSAHDADTAVAVYRVAVGESGTAGTIASTNLLVIEMGTAASAQSAVAAYHIARTETGASAASTSALATYHVTRGETAAAAATQSGAGTYPTTRTETGTGIDSASADQVFVVSTTATTTADASAIAVALYAALCNESSTAFATQTGISILIVVESGSADASATATGDYIATQNETGNAAAVVQASLVTVHIPIPATTATAGPRNLLATRAVRCIAIAEQRNLTVTMNAERAATGWGISSFMSRARDFNPPIDADVESQYVLFDFGQILATGVTIVGATLTCIVSRGTDSDASTRLIDNPILVSSPSTGAATAAVAQKVGNMVADTVYVIQCVVTTSDDQSLSLWSRLACVAPS